ncbi:heme-binding protein [Pararobbsia silviterrae]|uniref:Uncharacterized protein n=1 Tax=Pararobbsia silviterrae TaxID=1792498 RepID=A0A494XHQ7_9BURK|nr:heme-binding protein [Pararobbsia silviterrae]RKP47073.1 hypothetical protein D7S86_23250 [Pararobbsia silviterrae]
MLAANLLQELISGGRYICKSTPSARGNPALGVLGQLPGKWSNTHGFEGHAWNMIALPFGPPGQLGDFRLLVNQANETLDFDLVDLGVPNRGAARQDQHLAALRYLQALDQVAATDGASNANGTVAVPATPDTNDTPKGKFLKPGPGVPPLAPVGIHREPGIFLHLANLTGTGADLTVAGPDLARLANIPHGDVVLAMGNGGSAPAKPGAPDLTNAALLAAFSALPIGIPNPTLANPYLAPYQHFHAAPFQGVFDPSNPLAILNGAIQKVLPGAVILNTTTFTVDSTLNGGIQNIPFIIAQAQAAQVIATFWVQEVQVAEGTRYVLQYAQRVILEFFPRTDGTPGKIQWPHISVNTMIRELP